MQPVFQGGPEAVPEGTSRAEFVRGAYTYLAGALMGFVALSAVFHATGLGARAMAVMMGKGSMMWLGVLGAFMLVSWLATHLADNAATHQAQVAGLGIYVLAEALIFMPMFALANAVAPGAVGAAGLITALLVAGLTWTAFTSKTDFSFLGSALKMGGFVALGAIAAGVIFGFSLGLWFSVAMVVFAGAGVLYDTGRIIHSYPTNRPAGAALHLFASIALMLWYVLRILISLAGDD